MNRPAASVAKGAKAEEPEAVTVPLKVSTELAALELVTALELWEPLVTLDPLELLVPLLELAFEEAAFSPQAVTPKSSPQAIPPINA
jgi:hypothetical protein